MMSPAGVSVGLVLIAVGAILVWAVTGEVEGVDIDVVGWILMIVGAVAALLSLITWTAWDRGGGYRRRRYVDESAADRPRGRRREVVEEEDGSAGPPPA